MTTDRPGNQSSIRWLQFSKEPVLGTVKTRMMPHLSAEQALQLHQSLTRYCVKSTVDVQIGRVTLCVAGNSRHSFFDLLREQFTDIEILPLAEDMQAEITLPAHLSEHPRTVFYPGSTIGNYEPQDALSFLRHIRRIIGEPHRTSPSDQNFSNILYHFPDCSKSSAHDPDSDN